MRSSARSRRVRLALAELLAATGEPAAAASAIRRALSLYEAKGDRVAAPATRERFAGLLGH